MYANSLYGNREIPGVTGCHPQSARSVKAKGRTPDMYASGKSDGGILSMKRTNKGEQSRQRRDQPPAEFVEKRPPAEGNCVQTAVTGTQGLEAASIGLNRVREAAKGCCTLTRINVSASDLRQEPSAVVPHAWDLCGGCRVTGIPTATLTDLCLLCYKNGLCPGV